MIIYCSGKFYNVDDDRVKLKDELGVDKSISKSALVYYEVFVDDLYFIDAIGIYLEHKQFLKFEKSYNEINIAEVFPDYKNIVFIDIGTSDVGSAWEELIDKKRIIFNDYSEKANEGICYFSDIAIDSDRNGDYKEKYVKVDVRV